MVDYKLTSNFDTFVGVKSYLAGVELGTNYVLPSFSQMCCMIAHIGNELIIQSIIGEQGSIIAENISAKFGSAAISIKVNSVGNAYITNSSTTGFARCMLLYF